MSRMPVTFQERVPMPFEPSTPAGGTAAAFSAGDVFRAIKQRIFLILFVWLFMIGLTVGVTYLWVKHWPAYMAVARVRVESLNPQMPYTLQEVPLSPDIVERNLADQAVLAKSDEVLRSALGDAEVQATSWYRSYTEDTRPTMILDLQDQVSVTPIKGTSYLAIYMKCRSPDDPHVIVNSIVSKYLNLADRLSRKRFTDQLSKYKDDRDALARQIDQARDAKATFIATQLGVAPGLTQGLNVVAEALRALTVEATRLEAEKIQYKAMYDNLTAPGVTPRNINISPQMRMMIESDPRIVSLNNALTTLQQDRQLRAQMLGEKHREIVELDSRIAAVEQQLNEEMAIKEDQVRQYEVDQAEMAYLNATEADLQLQERLMELKEQQRDLDRQIAQLQNFEEKQLQLERNYEMTADYTRMLETILNQQSTVRVELAANAVKPLERSQPRWIVNVPIGTLLGLMIAVGLALGLEFVDTSVKTPRDIVRYVNVPILGTVPDVDDEEVAIEQVEMAAHTHPRSMVAEAFRNIRTNLLLSAPAERQRTILVTSPRPEDGKTTIATNLGISVAQSGRRVLLVDTNFRRPSLHNLFPDAGREGLSNALIGMGRLENLVRHTPLPNLDILVSGPIPPNPAELLSSTYMRELITQAVERYDQVIFDGPPVLLVSDALVLAGLADGVILICRARANSRGVAQRAREQLERVNAHLFGAVLNAAQVRRGGYFREQFRTFYEYQAEELPSGVATALPSTGMTPPETPEGGDRPA